MMKALLCKSYGPAENLVIENIADPIPGDHDVLIDVEAASLNFPDVLIIEGKYQFKPDMPFSPGGEVAGTISRIGKEVKKYKVGDRVMGLTGWGG